MTTRLSIAVAIILIAGAAASSDYLQRPLFCAPAAHVAGLLSGAPCLKVGDDYRLIGSDLDLTIIPACGAMDYFCLMAGFLSLLMTWRGFRIRAQLLVLPAAWGVTILINSLRLTACWQADRLAQAFLPHSLWGAVHMGVGIVTFLAGMTGVFWLMMEKGSRTNPISRLEFQDATMEKSS